MCFDAGGPRMQSQLERVVWRRVQGLCGQDSDPKVAIDISVALKALQRSGVANTEALGHLIQNKRASPMARELACWLAGTAKLKNVRPSLLEAFRNATSEPLLWESGKALVSVGGQRAASGMLAALDIGDPARATVAAWVLGSLRATRAVHGLIRLAANEDAPPAVRAHALESLGLIGSREASSILLGLLDHGNPHVRFWTVYALRTIGDAAAIPRLRKLAEGDTGSIPHLGSIRAEAEGALLDIRRRIRRASRRRNGRKPLRPTR
jgi:hypothetical protein